MKAQIPYGYRIVNGAAIPDPDESAKLRKFFDLYVHHGCSIATAKARAGIDRCDKTARNMLTNPVYLGTGFYPALLDASLMEKAKEVVNEKGRERGRTVKAFEPIPVLSRFRFIPSSGRTPQDLYASIQEK